MYKKEENMPEKEELISYTIELGHETSRVTPLNDGIKRHVQLSIDAARCNLQSPPPPTHQPTYLL